MVQGFFSNFVSLQLSLWHLDLLKASMFVPLPNWIQTRRAGNDCFKWAVLAGMHPIDIHEDRMSKYVEPESKYDFPSLHFPVPLPSVGSFAIENNMYTVYMRIIK